ncbi:MAG: hypothetical protein REI78_05165 [Pedobacter sp.]|nr:hypothetical protein [Pedobacter sp.]MDQ8052389.1 hypothetical protein [Pedobacter sp.]
MDRNKWRKIIIVFVFPNRFLKATFSVASGYHLALHDQSNYAAYGEFSMAMMINVLLIYLLGNVVYGITKLLNQYYPWNSHHKIRIVHQLLWGCLMPLLPAIALAAYFSFPKTLESSLDNYLLEFTFLLILFNLIPYVQAKLKRLKMSGS